MLDQVKIVLVGTSHSGNIGSAARAMKVMGLSQLVLVDPQCEVDDQTLALAAGAGDIAQNATVVSTLEEALSHVSVEKSLQLKGKSTQSHWSLVEKEPV